MSIRKLSSPAFYQDLERNVSKSMFIDYVPLSRKNRPPLYKKAGVQELWGRAKFSLSHYLELALWHSKYNVNPYLLKDIFTEHYRKFLYSFRNGSHKDFIPLVTEELYHNFFKEKIINEFENHSPIAIRTKIRSASSVEIFGKRFFQANVEFKYAFGDVALKKLEGSLIDKMKHLRKPVEYETVFVTFEKAGNKSPWRICGRVEEGDSYYTIPK